MQFTRLGGVICSFRGREGFGLYAVSDVGWGYMQFPRLGGFIQFRGREGFYAVSEVGRGKYSSYAPSNKVSSSSIQLCRVSFT